MFSKAKKLTEEVWWILVLSGILSIVFGFVALLWPGLTAETLVFLVALFTIIGGVIALVNALSNIVKDRLWWLSLLGAFVSLGIGVFLIRNPLITGSLLVILLAIIIFVQALYDLVIASYATKEEGRWMWIITGIMGLIVAVVVMTNPVTAALAFVWVIGIYAIVHGVVNIGYAIQLSKDVKAVKKAIGGAKK